MARYRVLITQTTVAEVYVEAPSKEEAEEVVSWSETQAKEEIKHTEYDATRINEEDSCRYYLIGVNKWNNPD